MNLRIFPLVKTLTFLLALCAGVNLLSCGGAEPEQPFAVEVPRNLGEMPVPENNSFNAETIALGKKLFYDPILSGNNKISCGSCHFQESAFADPRRFSEGEGGIGFRNSPALFNLAWMDGLFWDGGGDNLESQFFGPLLSELEMNQDLRELVTELNEHPEYPELFRKAFGSDTIITDRISKAVAQFERTLISGNSRYDRYSRGDGTLTEVEETGLLLVQTKCGSCHSGELFTDNLFHNTGLDINWPNPDPTDPASGRFRITRNIKDFGAFKTPSLRNVEVTSPYMHDGRFSDLSEVLDHYSQGVKNSRHLDDELRQGDALGIPLNNQEKEAILSFLKTLTDHEFLNNSQFSKD